MPTTSPVFTREATCQDCWRCIRECPVKAIRVENSCATVMAEACIACGHCVAACPSQAKQVRDDLDQARRLFTGGRRVVASLAPSYIAEFPELTSAQLIQGLTRLGFHTVSETARGAQEVSAHVATLLETTGGIHISSACPTAVDFLKKYHPHLGGLVTDLLSPMLTHARMLRRHFGDDIAVVFIGPCIAKKKEADAFPRLVDAALTFRDLRRWFAEAGIVPARLTATADDAFRPHPAREGTLYPIEGGMIAGIRAGCRVFEPRFMSLAGLDTIARALDGLDRLQVPEGLFLELLACPGGCINGPAGSSGGGTIAKRVQVITHARGDGLEAPRPPALDIATPWNTAPVPPPPDDAQALVAALATVGKRTAQDELNCGGCGYDSCRDFARALAAGRAQRAMCVSHMRKLAQNQATALLRTMPSAAVVVDERLQVVECNAPFARLAGGGTGALHAEPDLTGTALETLLPFARLFRHVLDSGHDVVDKDLHFRQTVLHVSIFSIEPHHLVGAILQDITAPADRREQVVRRTRQVIEKNLATVQRIAYLLGENAAETEGILKNVIDSFGAGDDDGG